MVDICSLHERTLKQGVGSTSLAGSTIMETGDSCHFSQAKPVSGVTSGEVGQGLGGLQFANSEASMSDMGR